MPVVATPTRRKFRGLARSRIEATIDFLDRMVAYCVKHPDKLALTADGLGHLAALRTELAADLLATVP